MCGWALFVMLLTLAVVLPTPHDYSGTFQGGYSARFIASRRVLKGARRVLYPLKQPRENRAEVVTYIAEAVVERGDRTVVVTSRDWFH